MSLELFISLIPELMSVSYSSLKPKKFHKDIGKAIDQLNEKYPHITLNFLKEFFSQVSVIKEIERLKKSDEKGEIFDRIAKMFRELYGENITIKESEEILSDLSKYLEINLSDVYKTKLKNKEKEIEIVIKKFTETKKKKCLILSSFDRYGDKITKLDRSVKDVLKQFNYSIISTHSSENHRTIAEQFKVNVRNADLIIAYLVDGDPKLYRELTVCQFSEKPLIALKCENEEIPSDFIGLLHIPFTTTAKSLTDLKLSLSREIRYFEKNPKLLPDNSKFDKYFKTSPTSKKQKRTGEDFSPKIISKEVFNQIKKNIPKKLDPRAREDFDDGLKCLRHELYTPAVMIFNRVAESSIKQFYKKIFQEDAPDGSTWGEIQTKLRGRLPKHDHIIVLMEYRRNERNTSQHPGERFTQRQAESSLLQLEDLIEIMENKN